MRATEPKSEYQQYFATCLCVWKSVDGCFVWFVESIVYNRAKVYKHQNYLNVVVHVILIDKWNQTARLYEIQETVIYSRAVLFVLKSECRKENFR